MHSSGWLDIETAPKDGTCIVCWREGSEPCFLIWKTNPRIVEGKARGQFLVHLVSYFGDPNEWDDYDLALDDNAPTHWHPLAVEPHHELK